MKGHFHKPYCKCEGRCKCNAKWAFIIDIGIDPKTGRRKQKKKSGFKTKKLAEEAAAKLIRELSEGSYTEESNITFEEFSKEWLKLYQKNNQVKENTVRVRKHELNRLLDYLSKLKLKNVTSKQYQDALNSLFERDFATNTIEGAHRTGRMIFKKAIELKLIREDPTKNCTVPKKRKTITDLEQEDLPLFMEKDELKNFLKTSNENGLDQDYEIFTLLAYTGMRIGELCALKWSDIDFKSKQISITKTYYNPNNNTAEYSLGTPKTLSSVRKIDCDDTVINVLNKQKEFFDMFKSHFGNAFHDENFIFINITSHPGYPLPLKRIRDRMKRLLKISGLKTTLNPHSLRHTHTSLLAQAGVNLEIIMHRLGHQDEQTTRQIYLHVTDEMQKEASIKFSNLMKETI
ncbi:tyrosine-type recombinase/integrase [Piscibacillus sp. B03]|uniref:tyrosine-type recombinase/integrase n=1 Tax=Piscibacillus sp. B03 TaxID=3457430 RepID=UPI003FCD4C61